MAWIKIEHQTPDKPEIDQLAADLGVDANTALGACVRFWIWVDQQFGKCCALRVTETLIDRVACCAGFAKSAQKIGWLKATKHGFTIPNFERHNGKSAKNRALSAERMSRKRYDASVTKSAPDKRREDKKSNTPLNPPQGGREKKRSRKETPEERTARLTARLMSYSKEPSNDGIPMAADPANPDRQLSDDGRRSDGGADPSMAGGNGRHHPQV